MDKDPFDDSIKGTSDSGSSYDAGNQEEIPKYDYGGITKSDIQPQNMPPNPTFTQVIGRSASERP